MTVGAERVLGEALADLSQDATTINLTCISDTVSGKGRDGMGWDRRCAVRFGSSLRTSTNNKVYNVDRGKKKIYIKTTSSSWITYAVRFCMFALMFIQL